MTIGVGFRCSDGIVIGSDTQYTLGSIKTYGPKLFQPADSADLTVAGVGAGRVSFMTRAIDKMKASFEHFTHSPTLEEVRVAAEAALHNFFNEHMYPMPLEKQKEFAFEFILGVRAKDGFGLFQTEECVVTVPPKGYCSIGYGEYVAEYALALTADAGVDVERAKLMATICIKAAKDYVDYCGGETRILTIQDTSPNRIHRVLDREIEEIEKYTDDLLGVVKQLIEFLEVGQDVEFDNQMLNVVIESLKESIEQLRARRTERRELAVKLEEKRRQWALKKQVKQAPSH